MTSPSEADQPAVLTEEEVAELESWLTAASNALSFTLTREDFRTLIATARAHLTSRKAAGEEVAVRRAHDLADLLAGILDNSKQSKSNANTTFVDVRDLAIAVGDAARLAVGVQSQAAQIATQAAEIAAAHQVVAALRAENIRLEEQRWPRIRVVEPQPFIVDEEEEPRP